MSAASPTAEPPPIVRQSLERALAQGGDIHQAPLVLSRTNASHADGSPVWFAEQRGGASGGIRAICDEATGELLLFSRDHLPVDGKGETGHVVRDASAVIRAGRRCLSLLGKADPSSWTLTAHPPTKSQRAAGDPTWLVQGLRGDMTFQLRLDPSTDTVLFYLQGKKEDHPPITR